MGPGQEYFAVVVQHMGKKETVTLPEDITIGDFQAKVEEMTRVPVHSQKVVHRGRDLAKNDSDQSLRDCRVKDKDIVMILGRPCDPASDQTLAAICELESQSETVVSRLNEIQADMDGIRRGFLSAVQADRSRPRLERRLAAVSEELMRLLERLDALSVAACRDEVRRKRKAVVAAISGHMDRADALRGSLPEQGV